MAGAPMRVIDLGRQSYGSTLELQRRLCRERVARRRSEDLLLFVEHDPVVTLGRSTLPTSLPLAPEALRARGLEVHEVERGGDVTLHAPGQLVGYPIVDLNEHRPDLHWYLRQLEGGLIEALAAFGIEAVRDSGRTGVWTNGRKIASIGIHVKQWVTFHGFALNVTTALDLFDLIVPCGLHGVTMTSVRQERRVGDDDGDLFRHVMVETATAMGRALNRETVWADPGILGREPESMDRR